MSRLQRGYPYSYPYPYPCPYPGKCLVSNEAASHAITRHLADYVLLWTTRYAGMSYIPLPCHTPSPCHTPLTRYAGMSYIPLPCHTPLTMPHTPHQVRRHEC